MSGVSPDEAEVPELAFDPMDPMAANANPQAVYKLLRDNVPVMEDTSGAAPYTVVSLHHDIEALLRDPSVFSSSYDAVHIGQIRPLIPLQIDPPRHATYRKLLDPLFAPRRVAPLEARTRDLVIELIDAVAGDGACNFHAAVAEPLPSTVFLQLLGLPLERRDEFIALKDGIIRPPATTPDERTAMVDETGREIYAVLEEVVAARAERRENDFVSAFLDAEVDGHQLSHEEVIDICYLFFLAGLDTVTASLDCMLAFLASHPEHRRRLVEDPAITPHAVEELLRWETPVAGVARITAEPTELSGCPIPAHQPVMVMIGSANTDERSWEAADEVNFDREVNKHLAFGGGVHRCLGSHLARMELRVVLEEWHARVPEYRLADGTELLYSQGLRQIDHLPLVW